MGSGLTLIEIPASAKTVKDLQTRWLRYRRLADACAHLPEGDAAVCREQHAVMTLEAYEDYYGAKAGRQAALAAGRRSRDLAWHGGPGEAGPGEAWRGAAGLAGPGEVWRGQVRQREARQGAASQARLGKTQRGRVRHSWVRPGRARRGPAASATQRRRVRLRLVWQAERNT